jgi:hypothetical protein
MSKKRDSTQSKIMVFLLLGSDANTEACLDSATATQAIAIRGLALDKVTNCAEVPTNT